MECDLLASWRVASLAASGEFGSEWGVNNSLLITRPLATITNCT